MNIFHAIFLGILQGITEFLPVSSSRHLIVAEAWLNLPVNDLSSFDVAVHFGTLLAIFLYFRQDLWRMIIAFINIILKKDVKKEDSSMILYLIIGTVPAVTIGLFFNEYIKSIFRNSTSVAIMLIIVALFFVFAEFIKKRVKSTKVGLSQAIIIGCAQALALVPGVSRSGITISSGLVQGVDREKAARFSFLLGSVAITAATVLSVYKVYKGDFPLPPFDILATGIISSFLAGYASVSLLMRFLKAHSLHIFAVYRIALALIILFLA